MSANLSGFKLDLKRSAILPDTRLVSIHVQLRMVSRRWQKAKLTCSLRCVRGLYSTRCPHSLHLTGSVVLIALFAPQSAATQRDTCENSIDHAPPQMYSITAGAGAASLGGIRLGFC